MKLILKHKVELGLLLIIIAAFFLLRLPNLTIQPIFADEAIYIRWAQVMKSEPTLRFLPLSDGKTPLFMWIMIPFFKVFPDPLFAGRSLSVLSGLFTLTGVFALGWRVFSIRVGLWAALLYTITPFVVFFDRMALVDSMLSAFTVWIVYLAILLSRKLRLDLAMFLGYLLGGSILTKTPGMVNLLILPISLLGLKGKKYLLKHLLLITVAVVIALAMYNMLRLGPNFHQLSARNTDYIFSPLELIGRPLDPFLPHFHDMSDWFPKLLTWPILFLIIIGVIKLVREKSRLGWIVLLWALIPLLLNMAFLKTFTARYLLTAIPLLLILAGFGLNKILDKVNLSNWIKVIVGLIAILPLPLFFNYQLLTNPPPKSLPKEERIGYFEEWTAGYGFKEIAKFLIEEKTKGPIVVGTEGYFGTLPDGLYIYLDKANIAIVPGQATISGKLKEATKDHKVFFVANRSRFPQMIKGLKLIKEYPKVISSDGKQDAIMLFELLPNEK